MIPWFDVVPSLLLATESDGSEKQDKQVDKTGQAGVSDETEEKYKDRGSQSRNEDREEVKSPTVSAGSSHFVTSPHHPASRKHSSPPAPDIRFLRRSVSPELGVRPRRHSQLVENTRKESAELTQSVTPQHRKLLANMAGGANSPKQERPQVSGEERGGGGRRGDLALNPGPLAVQRARGRSPSSVIHYVIVVVVVVVVVY